MTKPAKPTNQTKPTKETKPKRRRKPQLSTIQRKKLVLKAMTQLIFRPVKIIEYIYTETGIKPEHKTIKQDVDDIKRHDEQLSDIMASGGATHIVNNTISQMNVEINQLKEELDFVRIIKDTDDDRLPALYKQLKTTPGWEDLPNIIDGAIKRDNVKNNLGKRIWGFSELSKLRETLLAYIESFMMLDAIEKDMTRTEQTEQTEQTENDETAKTADQSNESNESNKSNVSNLNETVYSKKTKSLS